MSQHNETYVAQVGGDHYGTSYGHWDYCKDANTRYLPGAATKYVYRWRKKAGVQDLEKALSFLDKMIVGTSPLHPFENDAWRYHNELERFFHENDVGRHERLVMFQILMASNLQELENARHSLLKLIELAKAEEPTSAYVNQG